MALCLGACTVSLVGESATQTARCWNEGCSVSGLGEYDIIISKHSTLWSRGAAVFSTTSSATDVVSWYEVKPSGRAPLPDCMVKYAGGWVDMEWQCNMRMTAS
jgi:hypothetical protein